MKQILIILFVLSFAGVAFSEYKKVDGQITFAKWRCKKNGAIFYSNAERDAYISKVSVASNTFTMTDFENILPTAQEMQNKIDEEKKLSFDELVDLLNQLSKRVSVLEGN